MVDHKPERFEEFSRRYRAEFKRGRAVEAAKAYIGGGRVTLLYVARDPGCNHARVLADDLRKA